jgi:carbon starvation protein
LIQELLGLPGRGGAFLGTVLTAGLPAVILSNSDANTWQKFWILFGASNQLLAALTLLTITVWLHRMKKRIAFTLIPMLFVLTITLWALTRLVIGNFQSSQGWDAARFNAVAATLLIALALMIVFSAIRTVRKPRKILV